MKTQTVHKKRYILIGTLLAAALCVGAVTAALLLAQPPQSPHTSTPATETEQSAESGSQQAKREGAQHEATSQQDTPSGVQAVPVAISYANVSGGVLEIRAFSPGIIEGTATCTATLAGPSGTVTRQSSAFVDVSSTICEPFFVDTTSLSKGAWSITVRYASPDASGTSEPVEVTL